MDKESAKALRNVLSGYPALRPPRRETVAEGAARNLMIAQPGAPSGPWSAEETPYMVEPMNMLASRRHEAVCFVGPARTGKCLDVGTPVPTPTGWAKMGELRDGDTVFGPDGAPTTVLAAHAVKHGLPCFEVAFSDGSTLVADSEHLWGVERHYHKAPNWRYEVRTTAELAADLVYGRRRYRYRVRNTAPLATPAVALPLDPYLLGVWLGDGAAKQACVSSHREDALHYVTMFESAGHRVSVEADGANTVRLQVDRRARLTDRCQRQHLFADVGRARNGGCMECLRLGHHNRKYGAPMGEKTLYAGDFNSRLREAGVHGNKHIPAAYLRAGTAQRWALLQGLMDTDGTFDARSGCVEFTTTLPRIAEGFMELARTLGFKPKCANKATSWTYKGEKKHGAAFRITFPVQRGEVFSLPRKAEAFKAAVRDVEYRQVVRVEPVESRPVRCIQVDNASSLFLAGEGMVPTHNTMGLLDGWLAHVIVNDPGDFCVVQMTQEKAREYSKTRIDRALRNSPNLAAMKSASSQHDNTHDKMFKHGMWLRIAWPTVSNLSSSDYRYVAETDYDRMPDDIDGEGSAYALGLKRTTTFLSRGMCMVESSPGRDIVDPNWSPASRHEAPPTGGILGIYNRSDRHRWYWPCLDCGHYFEAAPGLGLFRLPPDSQLLEMVREANLRSLAREYNKVVCPHCGSMTEQRHKHALNQRGVWLPDGVSITPEGERYGEMTQPSAIAGYWMGGVAAAYQSWNSLVERHLQGLRDYALTGQEETLRVTINTDQGMPYLPRALAEAAESGGVVKRNDKLERYVVPDATRFLVASVDVQGGTSSRFVVQVHAIGEQMEQWPVDRYDIKDSAREGVGTEFAPIDPANYPEDWDVLTTKVLGSTYRTSVEGRELQVLLTVVDTGGEGAAKSKGASDPKAGVTHNAYAWFRRLKQAGLHDRVMLVKGASSKTAPMLKLTWVGNRAAREKGDVPMFMLNPNLLKDAVMAGLRRQSPGPNKIHVPGWVNDAFIDELMRSEVRNPDGTWSKIRRRNEAFDLSVYVRAGCLRLGADKIKDWSKAPAWAQPLESNREVVTRDERREMKADVAERVTEARPIVQRPAAPPPRPRAYRSGYLR